LLLFFWHAPREKRNEKLLLLCRCRCCDVAVASVAVAAVGVAAVGVAAAVVSCRRIFWPPKAADPAKYRHTLPNTFENGKSSSGLSFAVLFWGFRLGFLFIFLFFPPFQFHIYFYFSFLAGLQPVALVQRQETRNISTCNKFFVLFLLDFDLLFVWIGLPGPIR